MAPTLFVVFLKKLHRSPLSYLKLSIIVWCWIFIYYSSSSAKFTESPEQDKILPNVVEVPDSNTLMNFVKSEVPNLPLAYLVSSEKKYHYKSDEKRCGHYPDLWDLKFNNFYWQILFGKQTTFYLYNVYYDNRAFTPSAPSLRIISMISEYDTSKFKVYCQIWFEGFKDPVISKVQEFSYMWSSAYMNREKGILQPYIMRCHVPQSYGNTIPLSVSITEQPCAKAHNNLRVIYNLPVNGKKENIAVCVKGLNDMFSDQSVRLVEWLELVKILGADKVFMYMLGVHPNYSKVLNYYEGRGFVDVTKTSFPGDEARDPSLLPFLLGKNALSYYQNDLISLNDCFYRNLYRYKLITLLDIDEVIASNKSDSWVSLLDTLAPEALSDEGSGYDMFVFRNIYFLESMQENKGWAEDIPRYMYILQHVHRAPLHTDPYSYIKGFLNPGLALTLHNHLPFSCLRGYCNYFLVKPEDGHLQHYADLCPYELGEECQSFIDNAVVDTTLWKYKYELSDYTADALTQIGYFRKYTKN